ncbi:MAG: radical SAM protein [Haliscomenobacter sp.]|nr:radical SAM protein [Haliscomenobacter sp.]
MEAHQKKKVSTEDVIRVLSEQCSALEQKVAREFIRQRLRSYATIRHLEFHPTDVCNLTCTDCTYGNDEEITKPPPVNFNFEAIQQIGALKPKSMVIIGGGEPTLYVDKKRRFEAMIVEIKKHMPHISLALVTNGTFLPPGNWPNYFSWIRVSLDAATSSTYTDFRGKDMFDNVIKNYLKYLEFNVPYVGISFLFAKSNVHEYAQVAEFIYSLVKKERPKHLHKVNIQYRPLRRDLMNMISHSLKQLLSSRLILRYKKLLL